MAVGRDILEMRPKIQFCDVYKCCKSVVYVRVFVNILLVVLVGTFLHGNHVCSNYLILADYS